MSQELEEETPDESLLLNELVKAKKELEAAKAWPGAKREQLVSEATARVTELQSRLDATRPVSVKLRSAQDKLAHRRTQVEALNQQVTSLEEQLTTAKEERTAAQAQVTRLEAEVQCLLEQVVEPPPAPTLSSVPVLSLIGELEQRDPVPEVALALRQLREAQAAAEAVQQLPSKGAGSSTPVPPSPAGAAASTGAPADAEPTGAAHLAAGLDHLAAKAQAEAAAQVEKEKQAAQETRRMPDAAGLEQKAPEPPAPGGTPKDQDGSKSKVARTSPY